MELLHFKWLNYDHLKNIWYGVGLYGFILFCIVWSVSELVGFLGTIVAE